MTSNNLLHTYQYIASKIKSLARYNIQKQAFIWPIFLLTLLAMLLFFSKAYKIIDDIALGQEAKLLQKISSDQIIIIKIKPNYLKNWRANEYYTFFNNLANLSPQAVMLDLPAMVYNDNKNNFDNIFENTLVKIPNLYLNPEQISHLSAYAVQTNPFENKFLENKNINPQNINQKKLNQLNKFANNAGVLNIQKDDDGIIRSFNAIPDSQFQLPYLPYLLWKQQTLSAKLPDILSLQAQTKTPPIENALLKNSSLFTEFLNITKNQLAWQNNQFLIIPAKQNFLELDALNLLNNTSLTDLITGRYILIGAADDDFINSDNKNITDSLTRRLKNLNNNPIIAQENYFERYNMFNQKSYSGIEIHAQALNALIQNQAIWVIPPIWSTLICLAFAICAFLLIYRLHPKRIIYHLLFFAAIFSALHFILFFVFAHWLSIGTGLILLLAIYPLHIEQRMRIIDQFINKEMRRLKNNTQLASIFSIKDLQANVLPKSIEKNESLDLFEQHLHVFRTNIAKLEDLQQFVDDNLNALPDGVIVIDLHGAIKMMNQQARNCWQQFNLKLSNHSYLFTDLQNLERQCMLKSTHAIDWMGLEKKCTEQQKQPQTIHFQFIKEQHIQYIELKIVPSYNRHKQVISYLCILHDYTIVELAEQQRDETMRFLSHDMRAPQSSIIATLQMQKKQLPLDMAQQTQLLNKIEHYAQKTLYLAEDFVQMSKAEGKKYHFEEINLYELLVSVVDDMWPLAQKKHLQIHQALIEDAYVMADADLIIRAITNLLSNAIKYSHEHRSIWIELIYENHFPTNSTNPTNSINPINSTNIENNKNIENNPEPTPMVSIIITDEGPGISPENQKKLFARYERFTDSQKTTGIGLGLVFVKTVVDGHGGFIFCQSKEGRGTAFKFSLPYLPEK